MKNKHSHLIGFLWTFCFLTELSNAQPVIEINPTHEYYSIGTSVSTFVDETSKRSIHELLSPNYQAQFAISTQKIPNIGITDAALWCKFNVRNTTTQDCYLEIENIALDSIAIFEIVSNNAVSVKHSGSYLNFRDFEVKSLGYLFRLCGKTSVEKVFYLRIRHSRGTQFPIHIGTLKGFTEKNHIRDFIQGIYFGFMLLMIFYNLFVYFSVRDASYIYYVIYGAVMAFLNAFLTGYAFEYFWPNHAYLNAYEDILPASLGISGILFAMNFLQTKQNSPTMHKVFQAFLGIFLLSIVIVLLRYFMVSTLIIEVSSLLLIICFFVTAFNLLRKGYKQAKFFLYAWSILLLGVIIFILKDFDIIPYNALTVYSLQIGSALEALLLSFALADKINIYKNEKEEAQWQMLHSLKENEKLILSQNQTLEIKVNERTTLLNQSLDNLRATQAQLIQKEKLASLGELTAGIAHEIQNPLNFVNNFAEVSTELIGELKEDVQAGRVDDVLTLADNLTENLRRITLHGDRASNIVKGMLEHSRINAGEKRPTDLNALAKEYLNIAFYGLRAKDKTFDCKVVTDFDINLGLIEMAPQEIGQVLLNLFNNAFYAVQQWAVLAEKGYQPTILVSTKRLADQLEVRVSDNGTGISNALKTKIFQPFFTTKPTGQGTGLGLSLSYDIITKGHGGTLTVASEEGRGAEFVVTLPLS